MKLTKEERESALWLRIKAEYEDRLATQRKRNDSDLSDTETAKTRGRISEIKNLLAAGEETPPPVLGDA